MQDLYDVIIVGGGPAGLSAAIYLARAKYRVLVLEKEKFGGQITITEEIVNYPGVEHTTGTALTGAMRLQAEDFGAEFAKGEVTELVTDGAVKQVITSSGKMYQTLGIVLALGASPRKIGFAGEKEFQGRGVAYCATCDGEFFTGKEVLVVGGGFAAVEEAVFLTKYATKVTMIVREDDFTCAAGVADKARECPEIEIHFNTEVMEAGGEGGLRFARLKNNRTGEEWTYRSPGDETFGIFVFAGYEPATKWLDGKIELTEQGYIVTDRDQATSVEGVYAAGDVCVKRLRQVVTATGDGAVAATSLEMYVSALREKLGMPKADYEGPGAGGRQGHKSGGQSAGGSGGLHSGTGISATGSGTGESHDGSFISPDMRAQLEGLFGRFERKVTVAAMTDNSPASRELEGFLGELQGISEMVTTMEEKLTAGTAPYLDIRVEGRSVGIRYFSVPGGHEFNSFVIALYNAAGPGQELEEGLRDRINALQGEHLLQVMATLSCTNCPDVVMATQHIAALAGNVQAEMYDLAKFPEWKEKYQIMAVPCMVLDGEKTFFGKKNLGEIVEILEKA